MPGDSPIKEALHESLSELASTVGGAVKEDVGPIRAELSLVRSLLQDASQQLQESFARLNTHARAQLLHVGELHERQRLGRQAAPLAARDSDFDASVKAELEEFKRISTQVSDSINDAVRALQFEDMATQLIDCVQRRIARLDTVVIRLETIALHFEHSPKSEETGSGASITELRTLLTALKDEYATMVVSPVATGGMAAGGSIDLF